MKRAAVNLALLFFALLVVFFSIWGPEALARYNDKGVLNQIRLQLEEGEGEAYRYRLSQNEKLFILSQCLNAQTLPESDQSALTRETETGYQDLAGTYAFVVNRKGPSGGEITDEEIYAACSSGIEELTELGILPEGIRQVQPSAYDATLYSAIDVPEPRNNVAVWKMSLSNSQMNANKENRLLDAYIDADDGRIYEFYVRTPLRWEEIDTDKMIEKWSEYMGLDKPGEYETDNPLLETTPYYKKYAFDGAGNERTIVTVGFYEGINELFLKISK